MMKPVAASSIWLILVLPSGCASRYLLTVEDRVCRAGGTVDLVATLELRGVSILNEELEHRRLSFFLDGRLLGTADTDDDGYAAVSHTFAEPGLHRLVVAYERDGRHRAEAPAGVFVWREAAPILIVDVDGTVEQTRKRYLILASSADRSPPEDGAAEVLGRLARSFRIAYLTGRPREFIPKTCDWLGRNGLPPGPVLTWDLHKDPWSRSAFKEHRIDDLQADFTAVVVGVGDRETDHQAYRDRGLFSIILDRRNPPRRIEGGVRLPDWSAIGELFDRNPDLCGRNAPRTIDVVMPLWNAER
jgi:hypothetical protein